MLKKQLFDLDQKLEQMVQLPDNLNVIKPLSFAIKRGENDNADQSIGKSLYLWN